MWVIEAFKAFNIKGYDVEKYYLKWLRVLWLCERTWVRVLCMPIVCVFNFCIILMIYLNVRRDNKILKL